MNCSGLSTLKSLFNVCTGSGQGKAAFALPIKPGLGLKLLFIVVCVSLTGVLASTFLVLTLQRQALLDSAQTASVRLSRSVEASLEYAMLSNDWAIVERIAENLVQEGAVERVRILDPQGVARVSSARNEVGRRFERSDPECRSCHVRANLPTTLATVSAQSGRSLLLGISPLRNGAACQGCHDSGAQVLGYLLVETPLIDLQSQLQAGFWRMALVALVTLVLLVSLMVLALRRFVARPVAALAEGFSQIGAGNLDWQVQVAGRDELGDLAAAFETMRRQLKASRAETERRGRELAMLNEVGVAASQTLELQQILDLALDIVVNRLGMHAGLIYLRDPETGRFVMQAARGATPEQCAEITRRRQQPEFDIPQQVADSGKVWFVPRMAEDRRHYGIWGEEERRSYANVPLASRGAAVGSMGLVSRVDQPLDADQVHVLEAVGHQIGIAIDNALLLASMRRLAVLEERERLAREMHDNLAQSLGYLNLKASLIDSLLESRQIEEARRSLRELKEASTSAYRDVRESIFGLRAAAAPGGGFLPALGKYLDEYRVYYGVDTELLVEGERLSDPPSDTGLQITRIIQEALTNVRKHAGSNRAYVRIVQGEDVLQIVIEDRGRGFDLGQAASEGRQSFGLQVMRERAASVGGNLTVESEPGQGTRVCLRVPIAPRHLG